MGGTKCPESPTAQPNTLSSCSCLCLMLLQSDRGCRGLQEIQALVRLHDLVLAATNLTALGLQLGLVRLRQLKHHGTTLGLKVTLVHLSLEPHNLSLYLAFGSLKVSPVLAVVLLVRHRSLALRLCLGLLLLRSVLPRSREGMWN